LRQEELETHLVAARAANWHRPVIPVEEIGYVRRSEFVRSLRKRRPNESMGLLKKGPEKSRAIVISVEVGVC
jgi:hypothetical protein